MPPWGKLAFCRRHLKSVITMSWFISDCSHAYIGWSAAVESVNPIDCSWTIVMRSFSSHCPMCVAVTMTGSWCLCLKSSLSRPRIRDISGCAIQMYIELNPVSRSGSGGVLKRCPSVCLSDASGGPVLTSGATTRRRLSINRWLATDAGVVRTVHLWTLVHRPHALY